MFQGYFLLFAAVKGFSQSSVKDVIKHDMWTVLLLFFGQVCTVVLKLSKKLVIVMAIPFSCSEDLS